MIPRRTSQSCAYLRAFIEEMKHAHPLDGMTLVEIGTYAGDSAVIFADYFKHVVCVDMWQQGKGDPEIKDHIAEAFEIFRQRIIGKNISFLRQVSVSAAHLCFKEDSIDAIYIDAGHDYQSVKDDLKAWVPKVKIGGLVMGHDYGSTKFKGVKRAVDEILGVPEKRSLDTSYMTIRRK